MKTKTAILAIFILVFLLLATNILAVNTLTINNDGHGSTNPAGAITITYGVSTPINALPDNGYHFVNWTKTPGTGAITFGNATSANTTIAVTSGNPIIQANFTVNQYTLTVTNNSYGTTTPSGSIAVNHGSSITLNVTPNSGYHFVNWEKVSGKGTVVFDNSTAAATTATLSGGNATIRANFVINQYTLMVNDSGYGNTVPSGPVTVNHGVSTPISAIPDPGYHFVNWTKTPRTGAIVLGNANSADTTITVTSGNPEIRANFAVNQYTLTVTNNGYGTTTPSGSVVVNHGSSTKIIAIPYTGYHFVNWTKTAGTGTVVFDNVNSAGTTVIVTGGDATIKAKYIPAAASSLQNVIAIAGGDSSGYALKNDGMVWAWGNNNHGQLGNGSNTTSFTPVPVSNLNGITAIAGGSGGLALKNDGTVWAWGYNKDGELGDGTYTDSNVPVRVSDLNNIIAIAASNIHNLALKNDGTVWAWGFNGSSMLGNYFNDNNLPNMNNSNIPIPVTGLTNITAIAAGNTHSLALKNDGTVWAWGSNWSGELGTGTITNDSSIPVQVSGLNNAIAIAAGYEISMALKNDGTVWAWGRNYGLNSRIPVQVSELNSITAIACGATHFLALKNDGTIWAWGSNWFGALGNGLDSDSNTPVQVIGLRNGLSIAGGGYYSLALKNDGTVWAWGHNNCGQLGVMSNTDHSNVRVQAGTQLITSSLRMITAIASGGENSLAVKNDGTVWAWGTTVNTFCNFPKPVAGINGVIAVAGGGQHMLALENNGTVWAWGFNYDGQLGNGSNISSTTPVQVNGINGITAIASAYRHNLGLKNDGTVWAWGSNNCSQLGNAQLEDGLKTSNSNIPIQVSDLNGISAVATGYGHSLALRNDGTVWAWGGNYSGELGNGSNTGSYIPVSVSGLTSAIAVAGGSRHSLALKNDGTVWAWGDNYYGELGDGSNTNRNTPVQVSGLSDIVAIASGGLQSMALRSDGTVWVWGLSEYDLAEGTQSNIPVQISGLAGIMAIAGGGSHYMALKNDGTVWAWGVNGRGVLGNGTNLSSAVPVQVCILSPTSSPN